MYRNDGGRERRPPAAGYPNAIAMPALVVLFCLLLGIPLIEIYVLISVGQVIGAWWTVLLVVAMALLGSWMLRIQGLATLARVQDALRRGELPAQELLEGLVLAMTGVLLLTPGFVTDIVGFVFLLPGVRQALARALGTRLFQTARRSSPKDHHTLDGEFRIERD